MQYPKRIITTLPPDATGTGSGLRLVQRDHNQHTSPAPLLTRDPAEIKIRSDQLTSRILLALLGVKPCIQHRAYHFVEYKQTLPKGRGYVSLSFLPATEEPWEQVFESLELFGDELVDIFLVLIAVALDTHGPWCITRPFTITPGDILEISQKKKSKGSYPARQRLKVIKQIELLTCTVVRATLFLQDGNSWYIESPLLEMLLAEPQALDEPWPGYNNTRPWHLKIGDWATMVPQLQSQISLIPRQVLHYHARNQKYEKRLGRNLTVLYRTNAPRNGGCVKVSMGTLMEQAGITLDCDNPGRTRDAIESALIQLHTDGVIGSFGPIVESSSYSQEIQERIEQHAYHWWESYQQQRWLFEAPQYLNGKDQNIHRNYQIPD